MKFWINDSGNTTRNIKKIFINDATKTLRNIKKGFINVNGTIRQFFSSSGGGTPSIQNLSGTVISSAYVGDRLYGYPGTGTTGSWTYAFEYSIDGGSTWNTVTTNGGGTGSGSGTNRYYHTTILSDDNSLMRFSVTQNSIKRSSASVSITKYAPVLDLSSPHTSDPVLSGTANVGSALSLSSHWVATTNITNDTLPDSYDIYWTGNSGTTHNTWVQGSTAQNTYTIQAGDVGGTISVYMTATNSGGTTTTPTRTSSSISVAVPTNTVAPYWTDTSNNSFSGAITQGTTLRLHFGSWTGNPTYYEYQIYYNDFAGTTIQQNLTGTYTQGYVDYTFNTISTYTIGAFVYAGNAGGLSSFAYPPSVGPVQTPLGAFTYSVYDATSTPSQPTVNALTFSGGQVTYSWSSTTNTSYWQSSISGGPEGNRTNARYVTNDYWSVTSGNSYTASVYGVNNSTTAEIYWGSSTNAVSYTYLYGATISGTFQILSGTTTNTSVFISVDVGTSFIIYSVTAWTGSNGTGNSKSGTLSGNQSITITIKNGSAGTKSGTYGVAPSAPVVSGNNSIYPHGGNFYWSSATGTAPISYVFTIYGPSGSSVYSTNGVAVSTTSFAVGTGYFTSAGNYTIYVYARNASGDSSTTTYSQYMS